MNTSSKPSTSLPKQKESYHLKHQMRDSYFLEYCVLAKKLKNEGRTLREAQVLSERLVYGENPKLAKNTQSDLGTTRTASRSPPARTQPRSIVSRRRSIRLPASRNDTPVRNAITAPVRARIGRISAVHRSINQGQGQVQAQARSQVARLPAGRGTAAQGTTAVGNQPVLPSSSGPSQAREPTQTPGLFLNKTEPVVELAHTARGPTQATRPIKIERRIIARPSSTSTNLSQNVSQVGVIDRQNLAGPSNPIQDLFGKR